PRRLDDAHGERQAVAVRAQTRADPGRVACVSRNHGARRHGLPILGPASRSGGLRCALPRAHTTAAGFVLVLRPAQRRTTGRRIARASAWLCDLRLSEQSVQVVRYDAAALERRNERTSPRATSIDGPRRAAARAATAATRRARHRRATRELRPLSTPRRVSTHVSGDRYRARYPAL